MSYEELLAAAQRNPDTVDYRALRLAYTRTPHYSPYLSTVNSQAAGAQAALRQALQNQDAEKVVEAAGRLLENYYLDIEAHLIMAAACRSLDDEPRMTFHWKFGIGMLESILKSGDGRAFHTAFQVIDIREEYALLRALNLQPVMQSLQIHDNQHYDVFRVQNPQTGMDTDLYFNIEPRFSWWNQRSGSGEKPPGSQEG